ncbi:hypothetical protein ACOMHN_005572 [Nucella lapillus]
MKSKDKSESSGAANARGGEGKKAEEGCENYVHCALLGDGKVGKTCMTLSYSEDHFSSAYTATVFDNYPVPVQVGGEEFVISVFDTRGHTNHESLRAFTYEKSEVLVVCFSLCDPQSFYNVLHCWLPEIQRHSQRRLPLLLVGTHKDLRDSEQTLSPPRSPTTPGGMSWTFTTQDDSPSGTPSPQDPMLADPCWSSRNPLDQVSHDEGQYLAKIIGADRYIECSAKNREGVEEVFHHVVFSALKFRAKKRKIFTRLFGDFSLTDLLKNFSPPRLFETSHASC